VTAGTVSVWLRPGESLVALHQDRVAVCKNHGVPIVQGTFTWGIHSHPMYGGALETFPCWRHADGSACVGMQGGKMTELSSSWPVPACTTCGALDQFDRRDTGYGWDVTCRACGDNNYYDTGD